MNLNPNVNNQKIFEIDYDYVENDNTHRPSKITKINDFLADHELHGCSTQRQRFSLGWNNSNNFRKNQIGTRKNSANFPINKENKIPNPIITKNKNLIEKPIIKKPNKKGFNRTCLNGESENKNIISCSSNNSPNRLKLEQNLLNLNGFYFKQLKLISSKYSNLIYKILKEENDEIKLIQKRNKGKDKKLKLRIAEINEDYSITRRLIKFQQLIEEEELLAKFKAMKRRINNY